MREIKFRGKRAGSNEWLYGDFMLHSYLKDNTYWIRYYDEKHQCFKSYKISRETVGQYTGLKDKNGVEIYDGDIASVVIYSYVEPLLGGNFEVVYSENRACFVFKHLDGNTCYSSLDELTDINDFYAYEIEVVGNIHEVSNETTM